MTVERRHNLLLDAAVVGILWLLVLLLIGPALLPGQVLLPLDLVTEMWPPWQPPNQPADVHNVLISDVVNYIYPVKTFAADALRDGSFPLWNPYTLTGYPFTYNTQAGIFYPLFPLYLLFSGTQATDLTILVQLMLGALFITLYLRQLRLRRLAVLLGGVLFLFNGMMIVWLEWQVVHAAIIWLPLQLYFIERAAAALTQDSQDHRRARRAAILAGVAFALPWLGGHWNWTLYGSLLFGLYALWRLWPLRQIGWRAVVPLWAWMGGVGVGLSAVQVVPALFYLSQSHRTAFSWAESAERGLISIANILLVPTFFGTPLDLSYRGPDALNFNEATAYLSVLGVLLAGMAIFLRRDRWTRFYTALGVLGLLWALGPPAYRVLHLLPVFDGLFPSRAATLALFCGAVLAALALDRLLSAEPRRYLTPWRQRGAIIWCTFVALVALGYTVAYWDDVFALWDVLWRPLFWFVLLFSGGVALIALRARRAVPASLFGVLVVVIVAVDLFAFGRNYNPIMPVEQAYPPTAVGAYLQETLGLDRIVTLAEGEAYPPNTALVDRLYAVTGYEPGILTRYVDYIAAAEGSDPVRFERKLLPLNAVDSPLLDAINARAIVTIDDLLGAEPVPDLDAWLPPTGSLLLPLEPGAAAGVPMTTSDAGLQRIDVPLSVIDGATGSVRLRVFSADLATEFANDNVDVGTLEGGTASFFFTPFPSEWGRDFFVDLLFEGEGEVLAGTTAGGGLSLMPYRLPRPPVLFEDGKTRVFSNDSAFDRAYVASDVLIADDADNALQQVVANQQRLDEVVVIELDGQPAPPHLTSDATGSTVVIADYGLNGVTLRADMAESGYVVLSDAWYPGWQARIDGERMPLYRANSIVRAVFVPDGTHEIEMVFRPNDFFVAAAVSAVTLIVAVAGYVWPNKSAQPASVQREATDA